MVVQVSERKVCLHLMVDTLGHSRASTVGARRTNGQATKAHWNLRSPCCNGLSTEYQAWMARSFEDEHGAPRIRKASRCREWTKNKNNNIMDEN